MASASISCRGLFCYAETMRRASVRRVALDGTALFKKHVTDVACAALGTNAVAPTSAVVASSVVSA
jgi:hypothetical protein